MGKNSHRRERKAQDISRKKGKRPPYPRVLLVCEGSKTEPLYFEDIRKQNRVPSAHIKILHAGVTEPLQIVDEAENIFNASREYEWVFAVFDRDEHRTYHNALALAEALDSKLKNDEHQAVRFVAVPSVPCFELWLLLHYADIQAMLHRDEAVQRLRGHINGYRKGFDGVYGVTEALLPTAIPRAVRLQERFDAHSGTAPYTRANEVVQLLREIRA